MKKADFESLVPGKKYYVECGHWSGKATFVRIIQVGKRTKYHFTYGTLENWHNQYGHIECKSAIKVFELD